MIKFVRRTGKSSRSPEASINISQNLYLLRLRKRVFKMFYPRLKVSYITRQALYDPGTTTGLFLKSDSSGTNLYKRTVCSPALFMKTP